MINDNNVIVIKILLFLAGSVATDLHISVINYQLKGDII